MLPKGNLLQDVVKNIVNSYIGNSNVVADSKVENI